MSKHVLQLWVAKEELPQDIRGALDGGGAFPEGTQHYTEAHHSIGFLWLGGFMLFFGFFILMLFEYPGALQGRAFDVVGNVLFTLALFGGAVGCLRAFLKRRAIAVRAKKRRVVPWPLPHAR